MVIRKILKHKNRSSRKELFGVKRRVARRKDPKMTKPSIMKKRMFRMGKYCLRSLNMESLYLPYP
jgi:hypothetical protein